MKEGLKYALFGFFLIEAAIIFIVVFPFLVLTITNSTSISVNEFIHDILPLFYLSGDIFCLPSWVFHVSLFLISIFVMLIPKK